MTRLLLTLVSLSVCAVWFAFLLWTTAPPPWCGTPRIDVHDRTIVVCTPEGRWQDVLELPGDLVAPPEEEEGVEI